MARFDQPTLDLFEREWEVDVETARSGGRRRRTTIWIVVDGDEAFIRSWRGDRARWYGAALAAPEDVVIHAGSRAVPVRVVRATDPESVERCSRAFERNYRGDRSRPSMLAEAILGTTLRLQPRAG